MKTKRIIIFEPGATSSQIDAFIADWALDDVSVTMKIPMINGIVLSVPDSVSMQLLAEDYLVLNVLEDESFVLPQLGGSENFSEKL